MSFKIPQKFNTKARTNRRRFQFCLSFHRVCKCLERWKYSRKMLNFLSSLSDPPATGHVFIVSVKATEDAERISVSLACGKSQHSDIALMLLVNFAEGRILRNSIVNGGWSNSEDDENRTTNISNPVRRGDEFKIYILVGDDRFHVSIDGKPFCIYTFKVPVAEIRAVTVSGDAECVTQMDQRRVFPSLFPLVCEDTPDLVYSSFIPRKYQPGQVITISGVASGNPQGEFVIFFNENDSTRQLIHLNPRFDQQEVVINSMLGDDE